MAYSQSDLDRIRTAIARGEKSVQFADRLVTYRSVDELLEAEARIERALTAAAAATSSTATSKQSIGISSRGL